MAYTTCATHRVSSLVFYGAAWIEKRPTPFEGSAFLLNLAGVTTRPANHCKRNGRSVLFGLVPFHLRQVILVDRDTHLRVVHFVPALLTPVNLFVWRRIVPVAE